jgi:hypothetical protein
MAFFAGKGGRLRHFPVAPFLFPLHIPASAPPLPVSPKRLGFPFGTLGYQNAAPFPDNGADPQKNNKIVDNLEDPALLAARGPHNYGIFFE